jgi:hypothetical protein
MIMARTYSIVLLFLLVLPVMSVAQEADSIKVKKPHSPTLASILSAVAPGAGQIYNRKYWKLPIIYGGMGGLIYAGVWNHDKHVVYKDAYLIRIDDDPNTIDQFENEFSEANLKDLQSTFKRNRDLSFIFLGVVYALNIIDATVDAHLFDFDVSEDLSLQVAPQVTPIMNANATATGVGVRLTLR